MGRASRTKAARREARRSRQVIIYNPATGQPELHQVSISDEALAEWVANRERLRAQGYPDRPPDVDTPKFHVWRQPAGEPVEAPDGAGFVGSWTTLHPLGVVAKLLAVRAPDGGIILRQRVIGGDGAGMQSQVYLAAPEALGPAVDEVLEMWAALGYPAPIVATPADLEEAIRLVDPVGEAA